MDIDTEDIAGLFSELAIGAYKEYMQTGSRDKITEAVDLAEQGIIQANNSDPLLTQWLNNLGVFLANRYEETGEIQDLERAINIARGAIESTSSDHSDQAVQLDNLGNNLGRLYEQTGEINDLNEAIERAQQAVELTPGDHPNRAGRLNNLGNKFERRYERTGDLRDLEEAIAKARQSVQLIPDGQLDQAVFLCSLGTKLKSRYGRIGEVRDLDEAIETARQAVALTPDGYSKLAVRLNNLGAILEERYERTGEMRDLNEAIEVARRAIKSTPNDHINQAAILSNLANKLESRFQRMEEIKDLEEAIERAQQAIELTAHSHPNRAIWLNNLGNKLQSRYEWTGGNEDLKKAIETAQRAVELTPDDHPNRAGRLNSLGAFLERQYEQTGEKEYLNKAIEKAQKAVELTPDDHLERAGRLYSLGAFLSRRYEQEGEMNDLVEASRFLLDAWSCLNAVPFHRIRAAAKCLKLLATQNRVDEGINLGREIINLLPSVHTRALDRNDQQFVVSTFAGVASDLCALLLSLNRLSEALEYLEQGRAIIISQLLDDRSDLSSLRGDHSQLADRYQKLVDEVNAPTRQATPDAAEALLRKRRQKAVAELDTCLKKIRCAPGHERFMLGQTVAEIQECITEGSIVVINITDFRSDAIIIFSNSLRTIVLPELTASKARMWVSKDWSTKKSEQRGKNDQFLDYLSWLWHACVKHIVIEVSTLQKQPNDSLPRVWWIGSGLASSMPFHAAGIHTETSKESAYYKMISSYTPSIKALGYAQKQAKRAQEALVAQNANTMLIAAMPTSPKGPNDKNAPKPLRGVEKETQEILILTRPHTRTIALTHPSADQVLEVLETCRIAHFACHGTSDYSDPSNSGLILQKSVGPDEALVQDRLTVQRVSDLRLRYAQIAYLSACSTAENKAAQLSDEVIHVVSGFQVAGFPHVVGCLWPAGDSECVEVSKRFYSLVLKWDQSAINEVASALQAAVMAIRAEDISMPLNWAQFVHYGV
ncbi:hypothetical protein FOCG_14438 [Fusarium oxysporum f. sp. radicis-lycopersici 26381]|nr:hypothetical protein FOCG_14438 [Fusarium oxysporum f. sp. radicis-lycopersici 26381]